MASKIGLPQMFRTGCQCYEDLKCPMSLYGRTAFVQLANQMTQQHMTRRFHRVPSQLSAARSQQVTGSERKRFNLFTKGFDPELHPVSFPVFLELGKILNTFFRHFSLIDLVLVVTDSTSHLSRL